MERLPSSTVFYLEYPTGIKVPNLKIYFDDSLNISPASCSINFCFRSFTVSTTETRWEFQRVNWDLIFKSSNPICKFRGVGKGGRRVDICCKKHTYEMYGCVLSVLAFKQDWDWCWSCLVQTLFLPASFLLKSQDIEYTTVQWLNTGWKSFFHERCQGSCHNFLLVRYMVSSI